MAIAENTAHLVKEGKYFKERWIDVITAPEKPEEPEDDRPSEEIAADIWKRIRGN